MRRSPPARSSNNNKPFTRGRDSPPETKNHKVEVKSDVKRNRTPEKAKSRSKSRSLSPGADLAAVLEKLDEDFEIFPMTSFDDTETDLQEPMSPVVETQKSPDKPPEQPKEVTKMDTSEKRSSVDDVNEDELLGMSDDEISLGGNDIELDDLFNSEDSESENEGRFKSGAKSSKVKPTTVMPFSKLGTSSVTAVTSELTPNDRRETHRDEDRRRRDDTRRDWRSRAPRPDNRKEEVAKEESVVKKFKPLVDDKKRSNTPGEFIFCFVRI